MIFMISSQHTVPTVYGAFGLKKPNHPLFCFKVNTPTFNSDQFFLSFLFYGKRYVFDEISNNSLEFLDDSVMWCSLIQL